MTKDFVKDYLKKAGYNGLPDSDENKLQSIEDKLDQLSKQLGTANTNPPEPSTKADDFSRQTSPTHNISTNI